MLSLPGELVLQILEENYFNHKYRPNRRFLLSCCQVSRLWAGQAQPLLFRHIEVRRPSSFDGLMTALTKATLRKGPLKEVVLLLRMWIGCSETVSSPENLTFLLQTCPNLYGLSITFKDMWTLPDIPLLPRNIIALECCDWEGLVGFEVSKVMIRSGWHSIRFLTLRGYAATTREALSPNLLELRMDEPCGLPNNIDIVPVDPPQLNLQVLDMPNEFLPATQKLMDLSSHSLQSINITDIFWPHPPHTALTKCHRLKEFRFEGRFCRSTFDILRKLPIEHVAFIVNQQRAWSFQDFSLEAISVFKFLRVVSCLAPQRPWDSLVTDYMDDLQRICTNKRIKLAVHTNLPTFRALTRGDPVMTDIFPRGLAVPNHSRLGRRLANP